MQQIFSPGLRQTLRAGNPVTIGVNMNQYTFYKGTSSSAGEPNYDYIVPVLGNNQNITIRLYHVDDIITFSDNGESACIGSNN